MYRNRAVVDRDALAGGNRRPGRDEMREWAVFVAMHPSARTSSAGDRLGGPDDDEQPPTR